MSEPTPQGSSKPVNFIRSHASRFLKFGAVGLLGVGVNMAGYALWHEVFGVEDYLARVFAIEIAVLHNFAWNYFWTWKDRGRNYSNYFGRLLRYHGSTFFASFLIPLGVGWAVDRAMGDYPFANYISHLSGIAVGMMVNYLISDLWVFRVRKSREIG
ncbi:MAG TPA: GtrA family protein [Bacteroidetes bacterium]|nr:GtrA-like protein [bacterium BMS3Bbin04]HDO66244.1 GtrA family protein [Bacteroidota bacterium]HEX05369.1 GtrA family protein [Bacteroidota bacterium]